MILPQNISHKATTSPSILAQKACVIITEYPGAKCIPQNGKTSKYGVPKACVVVTEYQVSQSYNNFTDAVGCSFVAYRHDRSCSAPNSLHQPYDRDQPQTNEQTQPTARSRTAQQAPSRTTYATRLTIPQQPNCNINDVTRSIDHANLNLCCHVTYHSCTCCATRQQQDLPRKKALAPDEHLAPLNITGTNE